MSTLIDSRPDLRSTGGDEEFDHWFCCCSRSIALCGADIAGDTECLECDHPDCERCVEIADAPCVLCGYGPGGTCACGRC